MKANCRGLLLSILILTMPTGLLADSNEGNYSAEETWKVRREPKLETKSEIAPGSDAQFDRRLPPVLPGEVVNDSGRRMRVWSSSGPLEIGSPDSARCMGASCYKDASGNVYCEKNGRAVSECASQIDPSKISVIVDNDKRDRRRD